MEKQHIDRINMARKYFISYLKINFAWARRMIVNRFRV